MLVATELTKGMAKAFQIPCAGFLGDFARPFEGFLKALKSFQNALRAFNRDFESL